MSNENGNHECPECRKQKEALLNDLFPEKFPSECGGWTLSQLQQFKKTVAKQKQSQESIATSTAAQTSQNKLTIGNSLLGRSMNDMGIPNPSTSNPSAPIANTLFGKRVNEV